MAELSDFSATDIDGNLVPLSEFEGKVVLVVNVASRCVFTNQYAGFQALQREFEPRGFTILAFPCNQFGEQEPGDAGQIKAYCESAWAVTFPVFSKIEVNGPGSHPLYQWLKASAPGLMGTEAIKWNFTKFLIDRQGKVIKRFAPNCSPQSLRTDIEALL